MTVIRRNLLLVLLVPLLANGRPDGPPSIAVLSIELNNLHKTEPDTALAGRIRRLGDTLRERLANACGYRVIPVDAHIESEARRTENYLYEHPEVAAELARDAGAQWVIVPRVNRATAWVTDLQAHVVRVSDSTIVSNRIVEVKGLELTPELADRLIERGASWMADQVSQALEWTMAPGPPAPPRKCPA